MKKFLSRGTTAGDMSAAGGAGGKSEDEVVPTVYANVDGRTSFKKAATCSASMVDGELLEALADSRVFNARFAGVDLSLCRVYLMGVEEPADGPISADVLKASTRELKGKRTPLSELREGERGSEVYVYVDTTEARLAPAVGAPAVAPAAAGKSPCRFFRPRLRIFAQHCSSRGLACALPPSRAGARTLQILGVDLEFGCGSRPCSVR